MSSASKGRRMYPFFRMAYHMARARRQPKLGLFDVHVSRHRCWPWDIDLWLELNNGRTLTLFDMGRLPLVTRQGFTQLVRDNGLYITVAGSAVRYRRRIQPMQAFTMKSQMIGWDNRFLYFEQSMWLGDICANHVILRSAIARRGQGIVPPAEVAALAGVDPTSPPLPDWVQNWIDAETSRPWPPEGLPANS
jgi:acyl-CoA thioesterase FadM